MNVQITDLRVNRTVKVNQIVPRGILVSIALLWKVKQVGALGWIGTPPYKTNWPFSVVSPMLDQAIPPAPIHPLVPCNLQGWGSHPRSSSWLRLVAASSRRGCSALNYSAVRRTDVSPEYEFAWNIHRPPGAIAVTWQHGCIFVKRHSFACQTLRSECTVLKLWSMHNNAKLYTSQTQWHFIR